jgi:glycosyltransferase involved in cell wall biosynthesis
MSASGPFAPTERRRRDVLVGICDFPSAYDFPPYGYGGIERWLWAAAIGAKRAGADVHLLGPKWRTDLDAFTRRPIRLEELTDATAVKATGYDLLVVGHEYPSLPAWRRIFEQLDADVATFQHWPYFQHIPDAFDGCRRRLYCYSPEMCQRYGAHMPFSELAVHLGLQEEEPPATDGADLVWLGRIDEQKAPHIAVLAARLLGRRIRLVGPVFDRTYLDRHQHLLQAPHVELVGELGGPAKVGAGLHLRPGLHRGGSRRLRRSATRRHSRRGADLATRYMRRRGPLHGNRSRCHRRPCLERRSSGSGSRRGH